MGRGRPYHPRRGVLKRTLRVAGAVLAWLVIGVAALLLSLVYHLQLPLARVVARDTVNGFVSGEMAGELRIGRVDELSVDRIVCRHVSLYDPAGNRVTVADHVVLIPDLDAAFEGYLRFERAILNHGTVRLIPGEADLPTFIDTFGAARPSTGPGGGEPFHAVVDGMELHDVTVYGELLGLTGLRIEDVEARGRLEAQDEVQIRIDSMTGRIVRPFPFTAQIDRLSGTIETDPYRGLQLRAEVHQGAERARAKIRYAVAEGAPPDSDSVLDMVILGEPISARSVHQLGFDWAEPLRGEVRGRLRLTGPVDDLVIRGNLDTDGGPLVLTGRIRDDLLEVRGRTTGLDVARVLEGFPELRFVGSAAIRNDPRDPEAPVHLEVDGEPFEWEGYQIPALRMSGLLEENGVQITDAVAPYRGGEVRVSGRIGFDGGMNVHARGSIPQVAGDPNISQVITGARGALTADLHIVREPEDPEIDVRGTVALAGFGYGPVQAARLRATGRVRGELSRPRVDLTVAGEGVSIESYPLGTGELVLSGGPRTYEVRGRFDAPGGRHTIVAAEVSRVGNGLEVDAPYLEVALGEQSWVGAVDSLRYIPRREVSAERIQLRSAGGSIDAHGVYRFRGPDDVQATVENLDLRSLPFLVGDEEWEVTGVMSGRVELADDVENPHLTFTGRLVDGTILGVPGVSGDYDINYVQGDLTIEAAVTLAEGGAINLSGTGILDASIPDPIEAMRGGVYDVVMRVNEVDLGILRHFGIEGLPQMDGLVSGQIEATGAPEVPSFTGSLAVPAFTVEDWPTISVVTEIVYSEQGVLDARVTTADRNGALGEVEGQAVLDLVSFLRDPQSGVASLGTVPWRLSIRQEPRTVELLPTPIRDVFPEELWPLRFSLSGTFKGGAFETEGDLFGRLSWAGDLSELPCGGSGNPSALFIAELRDDITTLTLSGHNAGRHAIELRATAPTPLGDWLEAGVVPEPPPAAASIELLGIDAETVPYLCEYAAGPIEGGISLSGLFGDAPMAHADIQSEGLRGRRLSSGEGPATVAFETPPMVTSIDATLADGRAQVEVDASPSGGGRLFVHAEAPVGWGGERTLPEISPEGAVDVVADLEATPLGLLMMPLTGFSEIDGTVSGRLEAHGVMEDPRLSGQLALSDGELGIDQLGQHLEQLQGEIHIDGDRLSLIDWQAQSDTGEVSIGGTVTLDGFSPRAARLRIGATDFPVRQEGALVATLTARANLEADITDEQTTARLEVSRLDVELPDQTLRTLQTLETHADIRVEGERQIEPKDPSESYPLVLTIDAEEPFWVRRTDFAAQVSATITVTYRDPEFYFGGAAQIRRGHFEVFGKRFTVETGSMDFDGGADINPRVNLIAMHDVDGSSAQVRVTVTGRLSSPDVRFAALNSPCVGEGGALALLITGECAVARIEPGAAEAGASQAADFVAGVVGGIVTLGLQQELGSRVPVISIQSGDEAFRSAELRVGYQFDRLIPERLRRWVRGIYVEGTFSGRTARGSADDEAAGNAIFLLRLQFPHNIVGEVSGSPVSGSWGLDVTWEP